jgi:tetratricopeptide (TPR) repeat protein
MILSREPNTGNCFMQDASLSQLIDRGIIALQGGRPDEAASCFGGVLGRSPDDAEANSLFGLALVYAGRPAEAEPALRKAIALEPGQPGFQLNLCELLVVESRWQDLETVSGRLVAAQPGRSMGWRHLSRAAFEQGKYTRAIQAFERYLDGAGRSAANLAAYASLAMHAQQFDTALSMLDEAAAQDPDRPDMLATRAMLLSYLGRLYEAEQCCRRCLELDPLAVPAYTVLARLTNGRLTAQEMALLAAIIQDGQQPLDRRIPAAFALGHAQDAAQDFDAAFASYQSAHGMCLERNRRDGRHYDRAAMERRTDRLLALFTRVVRAGDTGSQSSPMPIFIVGMPRSGTTLVESVIAAHPRVCRGGERPYVPQVLEAFLRLNGADAIAPESWNSADDWRRHCLDGLAFGPGQDCFTDKNPLNFEAAGLLAALFPSAVIINVRRDPAETALSIYRNEFSKFWAWTDRLEDIAHYYGQYARLTTHWERTLGSRFLTIQYEDFAANFTRTAPALIAACGMEWDERCLAFQGAEQFIPTLSAIEVRYGVEVRRGAVARYRRHLQPLFDSLAGAGLDPVPESTTSQAARALEEQ